MRKLYGVLKTLGTTYPNPKEKLDCLSNKQKQKQMILLGGNKQMTNKNDSQLTLKAYHI